jgi:hypothetical protein
MSIKAMNWAWSVRGLRPAEKLVLMKLADHSNDDGTCWPGKASLSENCEISKRTTDAVILRLQDLGLIKVQKRPGEDGRHKSNLYFLNVAQLDLFAGEGARIAPVQDGVKMGVNSAPESSFNHQKKSGAKTAPSAAGSPSLANRKRPGKSNGRGDPKWAQSWTGIQGEAANRGLMNIDYPDPVSLLQALVSDLEQKGEAVPGVLTERLRWSAAAGA